MVQSERKPFFTRGEERWNAWSHAVGVLLGVVFGTLFLMWCLRKHDGWATMGVCLYLFGMLSSYVASTTYHAIEASSDWKERFRKWDHAAIYWHIAGSYSPITLVALRENGLWGWGLFAFVWLCALGGTVISFWRLRDHSNLETLCFVGMGLSVLVAFRPLLEAISERAVFWILSEGVAYITGAIFYTFHKKKYMHTVFHFFVLLGSICHVMALWHILQAYL